VIVFDSDLSPRQDDSLSFREVAKAQP